MRNPTYLLKSRHGIFYFRKVMGKSEVKKSLKTRDPKIALKRARKMAVEWDETEGKILENANITRQTEIQNIPFSKIINIKLPNAEELTLNFDGDHDKEIQAAQMFRNRVNSVAKPLGKYRLSVLLKYARLNSTGIPTASR
jgi:hypothetical protein